VHQLQRFTGLKYSRQNVTKLNEQYLTSYLSNKLWSFFSVWICLDGEIKVAYALLFNMVYVITAAHQAGRRSIQVTVSSLGVNMIELLLFWAADAHHSWEIGHVDMVIHSVMHMALVCALLAYKRKCSSHILTFDICTYLCSPLSAHNVFGKRCYNL